MSAVVGSQSSKVTHEFCSGYRIFGRFCFASFAVHGPFPRDDTPIVFQCPKEEYEHGPLRVMVNPVFKINYCKVFQEFD